MDILNQTFQQIKDVFMQLTPGSRVIAILLACVLLASLGYLFVQSMPSQSEVYLFDNEAFDTATVRRMEAAFAKAELPQPEVVGGKIRVASSMKTQYVAALADDGALPTNFGDLISQSLAKDSPWMTKDQRDYLMHQGKIAELQKVFSAMPGIESASVTFSEAKVARSLWGEKQYTAGVVVFTENGQSLDRGRVPAFVQTMVGAFAGLQPRDVRVVDGVTGTPFQGNDDGVIGGAGGSVHMVQADQENRWKQKIESVLTDINGVLVETFVELDPFTSRRESEIEHDRATTVSLQEENTSYTRDGADKAGRPGYQAQDNQPLPAVGGSQVAKGEHEEETRDSVNQFNSIPGRSIETEFAALPTKLVRASIKIPTAYIRNVWLAQNPPAEGEEPVAPTKANLDQIRVLEFAKIQETVSNILPDAQGIVDKVTLVNVSDYQSFAPPTIVEPTTTDLASMWFAAHWTTVGMFTLILVSMVMLAMMLRERPPVEEPVESGEEEEMAHREERADEDLTEEEIASQLPGFDRGSRSLKEDLTLLVNENPEAAANVLRQWIGNVAANA